MEFRYRGWKFEASILVVCEYVYGDWCCEDLYFHCDLVVLMVCYLLVGTGGRRGAVARDFVFVSAAVEPWC